VDKVSFHLFSDAGDAWGPGARPRLARLWSAGAELAADVTESYDLALSFRLGLAEPLTPPPGGQPRRARVYVAFASDF
jgi:hemolysin activation/secretion protein